MVLPLGLETRNFTRAGKELAAGGIEIEAECSSCKTKGYAVYKDRAAWLSSERIAIWMVCLHCRNIFAAMNFPTE
jgi:hypothetical protein